MDRAGRTRRDGTCQARQGGLEGWGSPFGQLDVDLAADGSGMWWGQDAARMLGCSQW